MKIFKATIALFLAAAPVTVPAQDTVSLSLPSGTPSALFSGSRSKDVLAAQVLLDRGRHSPGAIDGISGGNTTRAVKSFQRSQGMAADGKISADLLKKLFELHAGDIVQHYEITPEDVSGPFVSVPSEMEEQAALERLGYQDLAEKLAEKFHMTKAFLKALNPDADFKSAGTKILVVAPGPDRLDASVARVEIDKGASMVRAFDGEGRLVATYPATIGSNRFPSPEGSMEVRAIAPDPTYHFDPKGRDWGPDRALKIAAGPNNPVGSTWIDLTKEGYGIHGTPEPRLIGKTSSHGCVRLTNWDAEELSRAVSKGTKVEFV